MPQPRRPAPNPTPAAHPKTAARERALRALVAVETQDQLLGTALAEAGNVAGSMAFARELAAGVLRQRALLDHTLAPLLNKPMEKLDAPVRSALRLAAYERILLKTRPEVVGDEYAGLMRRVKLASAVGFVNAIARRLPASPAAAPPAEKDPALHLAITYSQPRWVVGRWLKRFGFAETAALCAANNVPAPLTLRVNTLRATRGAVLARLIAAGHAARAGRWAESAIVVEQAGLPLEWPEWKEGLIIAQDEAAQLVSEWAAPEAGQQVLDVAAAPGGKTTHLAQLMEDRGRVTAVDVAPGRIKLVRDNAARLGLSSIETVTGDLRELGATLEPADLVLLDAPCLGTGTWRRRPDARWRKSAPQLDELVTLQRELWAAAAALVAPGGALVYSTCSLEPEENEGQVAWWLEREPKWRVETPATFTGAQSTVDKAALVTAEGFLQTLPHRDGCDGAFAVKLRRGD